MDRSRVVIFKRGEAKRRRTEAALLRFSNGKSFYWSNKHHQRPRCVCHELSRRESWTELVRVAPMRLETLAHKPRPIPKAAILSSYPFAFPWLGLSDWQVRTFGSKLAPNRAVTPGSVP